MELGNRNERAIIARTSSISALRDYDVVLIREPHLLGHGDCQNWAFDQLDLPQYTWRENEDPDFTRKLLEGEIPELRRIRSPKKGCLAAYLGDELYVHYGLYQGYNSVLSRWGSNGPLFEHPIEMLPLIYSYGDLVDFYEKV